MQSRSFEFAGGPHVDAHKRLHGARRQVLDHGQDHDGRDGVLYRHHGDIVLFVQLLDLAERKVKARAGVGARVAEAGDDVSGGGKVNLALECWNIHRRITKLHC